MRSQVGGPPSDWQLRAPLLDGLPLEDCTLADEEENFAEVYQRDPEGRRRVDVPPLRLEGEVRLVSVAKWGELKAQYGSWQQYHLSGDSEP